MCASIGEGQNLLCLIQAPQIVRFKHPNTFQITWRRRTRDFRLFLPMGRAAEMASATISHHSEAPQLSSLLFIRKRKSVVTIDVWGCMCGEEVAALYGDTHTALHAGSTL